MKERRVINGILLTALLTVVLLSAPSTTLAADAPKIQVALIINPKLAVKDMTKKDLKDMFLGKKTQWADKDKTPVVFVMLKGGDVHKQFLKDFVGKTEAQFKTYWKKQVFTGKAKMPKDFKTEKEMMAYIAKTKGAIGYADIKTIADQTTVKKLTVKK